MAGTDSSIRTLSQSRPKEPRCPTPCHQCGELTYRPKYCSQKCGSVAYSRRSGVRPLAEFLADVAKGALTSVCPECDCCFRPSRFGNHRNGPQRFCSRSCRHAAAHRRRAIASVASELSRWGKPRPVPSRLAAMRRWRERAEAPCRACGAKVGWQRTRIYPARTCSVECFESTPEQRSAKRRHRALRDARKRNGALTEGFDPLAVLRRDGWRCYICGVSTPQHLRGTWENNAPEVDHIIPLAAGGEHSMRNTACACRRCNAAKGARPLAHMKLAS